MSVVKIGGRHQVVIPNEIFSELDLRVGDYVEATIKNKNIILRPQKMIPKKDSWFHSKEWQEGEAQADKDLAEENYKDFNNSDDLIKDLKS